MSRFKYFKIRTYSPEVEKIMGKKDLTDTSLYLDLNQVEFFYADWDDDAEDGAAPDMTQVGLKSGERLTLLFPFHSFEGLMGLNEKAI